MEGGWEVDFIAQRPGDPPLLVQVSLETAADATFEREVRALAAARSAFPAARALLVTLDPAPPARALPAGLEWLPAAAWFLEEDG